MTAVIFIGLQASGKSTFYRDRFLDSHVRINLDMLKTRRRENVLLAACLEAKQPFVVDNTNPTKADRLRYIPAAREAGFKIVGYYFQSKISECMSRNEQRPKGQVVPRPGLLGTSARIERPEKSEGFDKLYYVRIDSNGAFVVEAWNDEI